MTGRRVLVCGGRDYADADLLNRTLDAQHELCEIKVLIHGHARGADTLADQWAARKGIARLGYRAQWDKYGKGAGHIRNTRMLEGGRPTVVIAFPGGRGTADMVAQARAAGVRVIEIAKDNHP